MLYLRLFDSIILTRSFIGICRGAIVLQSLCEIGCKQGGITSLES